MNRAPVVDVHTHMLTKEWVALLEQHGSPRYTLKEVRGGLKAIHLDGAPFMTPIPPMFDWELRIANMNKAGVDIAVTSLTCPNTFWGSAEVSLKAARIMNDDMAKAQKAWPDRIRWFASLPWQHASLAVEELKRSCEAGAVGVMVLANIAGKPLTDPAFAPIWKAIDDRKLPVLVHPSAPPGTSEMGLHEFQLTAPIGFTFDTSLAIARCIYDGFLDRYPNLKLIASHGGGALPYLVGRLDICWDNIPAASAKTEEPPRNYMRRIYVDSVVFRQDVLDMCVSVCGSDNVLYGSDYPHTIGDMIGCLSRVDALPSEVSNKVRGWNAQRIFNL
ncbi:MAG TPA: amidohydrolase family protein [Burkholderiales bacterium]|nr:amidohydrolase family protein [Burkholderiales bacterium]